MSEAKKGKDKIIKKSVALRYNKEEDSAPKVVAQGKGEIAEKILELAREHDIAVHEDPALVDMLSLLDIGSEIPDELYEVVARILVFVYNTDKKYEGKGPV